ncbi:MAG: DUF4231 domain-containing protein [Cyanobacteria bacterium]|nr:DUF4231 domain-containing protein [Cyanobacteriota bacterium]MDA0866184.1 DUF4231 domain-containing protein [Cyanobacteriota bacterium]
MSPTPDPNANKLLKAAWQRQAAYDQNASRYQRRFVFIRTLLSVLSVAVVILAVMEGQKFETPWGLLDTPWDLTGKGLLLLPVTITALLAFSVRFDRGQNWVLLRGNAESLKMEIYYYRTRVGAYQHHRNEALSKRIKQISEGLKGSPIHQGALSPYEEELDSPFRIGIIIRLVSGIAKGISGLVDRLWAVLFQFKVEKARASPENDYYSDLTDPETYLKYRLENQFDWYRSKAKKMAQQLQAFQAGIYLFGGIGTLLATTETYNSSVAITTAMVSAFNNYLEFKRVEISLVGYNQAADTLYDIRVWWYSLSDAERGEFDNFSKLVTSCEETIHSENSSWLQDMQDRLAQLYGNGDDDNNGNHPSAGAEADD